MRFQRIFQFEFSKKNFKILYFKFYYFHKQKDDAKDFPNGVRYGLLFENIDSWWDKSRLFRFLSKIHLEG